MILPLDQFVLLTHVLKSVCQNKTSGYGFKAQDLELEKFVLLHEKVTNKLLLPNELGKNNS